MTIVFISLFYVSLLGIVLLFLIKYIEIKTSKSIIPESVVVLVEKSALRFFLKIARVRSHLTKENIAHIAQPLRQKLASTLLVLQRNFNFYFSKVVDMVRGKGSLMKRGKSSNFLSNVAEYKNLDKSEGSHRFL